MGAIGWCFLVDQANTETGGASNTVADVTSTLPNGFGIGGRGLVNTFSSAPPYAIPIEVEYLDIQDSNALPPFVFYATNSVDSGNNNGWGFL